MKGGIMADDMDKMIQSANPERMDAVRELMKRDGEYSGSSSFDVDASKIPVLKGKKIGDEAVLNFRIVDITGTKVCLEPIDSQKDEMEKKTKDNIKPEKENMDMKKEGGF
jgi:hypothetical protein